MTNGVNLLDKGCKSLHIFSAWDQEKHYKIHTLCTMDIPLFGEDHQSIAVLKWKGQYIIQGLFKFQILPCLDGRRVLMTKSLYSVKTLQNSDKVKPWVEKIDKVAKNFRSVYWCKLDSGVCWVMQEIFLKRLVFQKSFSWNF